VPGKSSKTSIQSIQCAVDAVRERESPLPRLCWKSSAGRAAGAICPVILQTSSRSSDLPENCIVPARNTSVAHRRAFIVQGSRCAASVPLCALRAIAVAFRGSIFGNHCADSPVVAIGRKPGQRLPMFSQSSLNLCSESVAWPARRLLPPVRSCVHTRFGQPPRTAFTSAQCVGCGILCGHCEAAPGQVETMLVNHRCDASSTVRPATCSACACV